MYQFFRDIEEYTTGSSRLLRVGLDWRLVFSESGSPSGDVVGLYEVVVVGWWVDRLNIETVWYC